MCRGPALAEPLFLSRRDPENLPDLWNLEIQIWQALDAIENRLRDVVGVPQLIGTKCQRARKKADYLGHPVTLINQVTVVGSLSDCMHQIDERILRNLVEGVLHASGEPHPHQANFFGRTIHARGRKAFACEASAPLILLLVHRRSTGPAINH